MTEASTEKLIAELGEEMDKKRFELTRGTVPSLHECIERALTLRASLQDVQASNKGSVPNSGYALAQIRSSEQALREYQRGKEGDTIGAQPDTFADRFVADVAQILKGSPHYEQVTYPRILQRLCGKSTEGVRRTIESLQQDLDHADLKPAAYAFFWGIRLKQAAYELLEDELRKILTPDLKMSVGNSAEHFWRLKILGIDERGIHITDGIEFLHGFIDRMTETINNHAKELYGEGWERALNLWQDLSAVPRISRLTPNVKKVRTAIAHELSEGNLDEAEHLLTGVKEPRQPLRRTKRAPGLLKELE